jgi:tetratricopeptide (TPR) repeat protein
MSHITTPGSVFIDGITSIGPLSPISLGSDSSSSTSPSHSFSNSNSSMSVLDEPGMSDAARNEGLRCVEIQTTNTHITTSSGFGLQRPKGYVLDHLAGLCDTEELITNFFIANPSITEDLIINKAVRSYSKRKYTAAVRQYRQALARLETVYGKDHVYTTDTMTALAWALHRVGSYWDALELHKRVLRINQSHFGVDHFCTADAIMNIGLCKQHASINVEAMEDHKNALRIKESVLGKDHINIVDLTVNIGILHHLLGREDIALKEYERALMIRKKVYGEMDASAAHIYMYVGTIYLRQGRYVEAFEQYERTLELGGSCLNTVGDAMAGMADIFYCLQTYDKALQFYKNALKIKCYAIGGNSIGTAAIIMNIGLTFIRRGEMNIAQKYMCRSHNVLKRTLGEDHPQVLKARDMVKEFRQWKKAEKKEMYIKKGRHIMQGVLKIFR